MPLLVADIGNAHTVLGLLEPGADGGPGTVGDHWRIATDERRTADEWAVLLRGRNAPGRAQIFRNLVAGETQSQ
mgnify:CR=1 FL=1